MEPLKERFRDPRTKNVLGFLASKGYLITQYPPKPNVKIRVGDALWVAENVEPRVYEVLPAALIHFPATFLQKDQLPKELGEVLKAIQNGKTQHKDFLFIPYDKMRRWADHVSLDRRTKPVSVRKSINKTFRLSVVAARSISEKAKIRKISESMLIEELLLEK